MTYGRLGISFLAALLWLAPGLRAQDAGSSEAEYLIKAGYIYNFTKLVEWPPSAAPKGQTFVIGVLGNDTFAAILERTVDGKLLDGKRFVVKRLKAKEYKDCGCRILVVSRADGAQPDEILQFQRTASVLTIGEAPDFARRGGIIAFTLDADSRVRFEVNVEAAKQSGLNISSRLLTLATIVQTAR